MKIFLGPAGVPSSSAKSDTVSGILEVSILGLDAMEIEFVRGIKMKNDLAKEVGKVSKEKNILLSVHAPYYINLCNPEVLDASKKRILDSCERAHHMGAWVVVFHPGYYGKLEKEEAFKMVFNACKDMQETLNKKGWKVKLGLETTGKVSQFGTVDEILGICEKLDSCVPVIDWAHLFALHQGKADFKKILEKVISAGYKKIHTHFSNIEYTEKGERKHLSIDHKEPDFSKIAGIILKSALDEITLISESPLQEKDALEMKKILNELGHDF